MSDPAKRDTFCDLYRELEALPDEVRAEIVAGEITVLPRPRPKHVRVASRLGSRIEGPFGFDSDGPGGWVVLDEPEIRFADELRIPDIAAWRVERYVEPEDPPYVVRPDWICEILSPSTARTDRSEKLPLYARHGVPHVWLIDPETETLEVYRRQGELWLLVGAHAGNAKVCAEPFDAIELDLGALWRTPGSGPVSE